MSLPTYTRSGLVIFLNEATIGYVGGGSDMDAIDTLIRNANAADDLAKLLKEHADWIASDEGGEVDAIIGSDNPHEDWLGRARAAIAKTKGGAQ